MESLVKIIGLVVVALIVAVGLDFLLAIPTMYLWNWLMPKIFNLTTITYWQAWGLSLLASLLFGKINLNSKKDD